MPRLTLRTLLAYIDDTLEPTEARSLGKKVAESEDAKQLVDRIKKVTRRRGLATPVSDDEDDTTSDPNTVAEYLDNALDSATVRQVEETCLESDVHLAEVAACHQILTLVLTEPVRVPPRAHKRMYELVQPPASVPDRRPSKTLPVSGTAPPSDGPADADDADAALLLGMKRYSATTTWAARFALFGAAAVLLVLLAGAVLKTLSPPDNPQAPAVAQRTTATAAEPKPHTPEPVVAKPKEPDPIGAKPKEGDPVPSGLKPKDPGGAVETIPPPRPVVDPWDKVDPPSDLRAAIGRVDTKQVLVVSYRGEPGAGVWGRLPFKPATDLHDNDSVYSTDPVMALPGYKADVLLGEPNKPIVEVHLWGNAPEQVPFRVLESKVTFHKPAPGFDADVTLHAGRIYLKNKRAVTEEKPVAVKVRVRLANSKELWDVTLPDANSDVLVELISWFTPGTPFAVKGGQDPKREARFAVLKGPVDFLAGTRFKKFDRINSGAQVQWDSVTGVLSDPGPIANPQEIARIPLLEGKFQMTITRVLSEMADQVTVPDRVKVVLTDRLDPKPDVPARELVARLAIYSWGAIAESNEAGAKSLQELVNILNSELPWLSRQAVTTVLVQWVAREKGNTALLHALLSRPDTGVTPGTADAVVEMLRGYISPTQPDPATLDKLVERLGGAKAGEFEKPEKALALRDVALWNLAAAEQGVWIPSPVLVNVGAVGAKFDTDEYRRFLADWKARVDRIKKRPPPK